MPSATTTAVGWGPGRCPGRRGKRICSRSHPTALPATAYWIVRSSRTMTAEVDASECNLPRRPGERRDPYRVISLVGTVADAFGHNERRWLWVPALAGTTRGGVLRKRYSPSPSLPRRDFLALAAVVQFRLRPPAAPTHH